MTIYKLNSQKKCFSKAKCLLFVLILIQPGLLLAGWADVSNLIVGLLGLTAVTQQGATAVPLSGETQGVAPFSSDLISTPLVMNPAAGKPFICSGDSLFTPSTKLTANKKCDIGEYLFDLSATDPQTSAKRIKWKVKRLNAGYISRVINNYAKKPSTAKGAVIEKVLGPLGYKCFFDSVNASQIEHNYGEKFEYLGNARPAGTVLKSKGKVDVKEFMSGSKDEESPNCLDVSLKPIIRVYKKGRSVYFVKVANESAEISTY